MNTHALGNEQYAVCRGAIHCARWFVSALRCGRNEWRSYILGVALLWTATGIPVHAETLVDPTRPAHAQTKSSVAARSADPISRVTAIFRTGERRVAVIDGRVVKAGDRIGDVVIQEILVDGVRFTRGGRVEVARLPKPAVSVRSDARKPSIRQESDQ